MGKVEWGCALVSCLRHQSTTLDLLEDPVGSRGPDERAGAPVRSCYELVDRPLQVRDALERPATESEELDPGQALSVQDDTEVDVTRTDQL